MSNRTTPQRLAANRTNATHSTGPRTPLGKARSSQNARKHSFAGTDFSIIKIEEREAVDRLRADLIAVYQPLNSQETFAVERIALARHNLLRIARFEAGLFTAALNRALLNPEDETPFVPNCKTKIRQTNPFPSPKRKKTHPLLPQKTNPFSPNQPLA